MSKHWMPFGMLLAAAAGLFGLYLQGNPPVLPLDDAYIHFVYARNLAGGQGLCFNAGETSFGTSSPLWVALLALWAAAGADLYRAALAMCFFGYFCTAALVFLICRELLRSPVPAMAAAFIYLSSGNATWLAAAGMETAVFQALGLLCVYLYMKRGCGPALAVAAGLLLLCRITGLLLLLPLLTLAVRRDAKCWPSLCITGLIAFPFYAWQPAATGSLFPVTGRAKLLTYVSGDPDLAKALEFLAALLKYLLLYDPAFLVLATVLAAGILVSIINRDNSESPRPALPILGSWAVLHVAAHALMFRSLNHHGRYLAVVLPVLCILGTWGAVRALRNRTAVAAVLGLVILAGLSRQPVWMKLYGSNVRHMNEVYFRCARWVVRNTADGPVAAFDVGILKYVTGRTVLDLGGVTSPEVHPYLVGHEAGALVRKKKVSLIVYSRFPDCDVWPGVYRACYDRRGLLRQSKLAAFVTEPYGAPSITHSFQLEVFRVDGWVLPEDIARSGMFYDDSPSGRKQALGRIAPGLDLVGVEMGKQQIRIVRNMAQFVLMSYTWRVSGRVADPPRIRTLFVNRDTGEVVFDRTHIPTHGVFPIAAWDFGRAVREEHVVWIPDHVSPGRYDVWVCSETGTPASSKGKPAGESSRQSPQSGDVLGIGSSIKAKEFVIIESILKILY